MADKKYYVSEGKALTTKAGIKGSGKEISAKMVEGGAEKLALLAKAGLITTELPKELKEAAEAEKKAKAEKLAAEKLAAEKLAADKLAAEKTGAKK